MYECLRIPSKLHHKHDIASYIQQLKIPQKRRLNAVTEFSNRIQGSLHSEKGITDEGIKEMVHSYIRTYAETKS